MSRSNALAKISRETKKRCRIFEMTGEIAKKFKQVKTDQYVYLKEFDDIDFPLYFRLENYLVEYIKPKEFSEELLDRMGQSLVYPDADVSLMIRRKDVNKLHDILDQARSQKIQTLIHSHRELDGQTLLLFEQLSGVSQTIVKDGLSREVTFQVKKSADYLVENLRDTHRSVHTLLKMFSYDPSLYDHCASVAMFAVLLGMHLKGKKLSASDLRVLAQAGMYHDIGKTCLPTSLVNKPGRFSPEEYETMKTHTLLGEKELERIAANDPNMSPLSVRVAAEHHEDFSGTGYPRKKLGRYEDDQEKGIHLFSRIVTIADVYSALLMKRSYQDAYDPTEAIKIMRGLRNKFDPELLEIFLSRLAKAAHSPDLDGGRIFERREGGKLKLLRDSEKNQAARIQNNG